MFGLALTLSCLFVGCASHENFCDGLDGVLTEEAGNLAGMCYFFKGSEYFKYDCNADKPVAGYPLAISKGWPGLPNDISGILTEPAEGKYAGYAFVFKGKQVWKWDTKEDKLVDGYPKDFASEWPGLPSDWYSGIDSVFAETALGKYHGCAYFFKGNQYVKYDLVQHKALYDPGNISIGWPQMPNAPDAILMEPDSAGLKGQVYWFKGSQYWKWNAATDKIVHGAMAISQGWNLCPPAPAPPAPTPSPASPEQVHLALGKTGDSMTVAWVTVEDAPSQVQWGEGSSLKLSVDADSRKFTMDSGRPWYTHVATMTGLKPNTRYSYRVGGAKNYSKVFDFMHRRVGAPYRHIILGDLGASNGYSVCNACNAKSAVCDAETCKSNTTVGLVAEVDKADMFLHLGDFAYDLNSDNGKTGDQFMRNIEQIAARSPYMVNHGNHEDGSGSLAHYIERFRSQPSNAVPATFTSANGETTNSLYFSWDYGLVHYVSISTELWFGVTDHKTTKGTLLDWLKKDLAAANKNRAVSPWIIVQGHRSVYCSCDGDCDGAATTVRNDLEEIFMDYGVDFFMNGHEHNYERSYPIYKGKSDRSNIDPKAPIYVVSGAAGSREMHEPFTRKQPSWSVFRSNTFGYSVLTAHNATHVHLQYVSTDPTSFPLSSYGSVIDDGWIVQHSHGPFDRKTAPTGEAFTEAPARNRQLDHWWPILNLTDNGIDATDEIIRQFRSTKDGEEMWKQKLNGLMEWVESELHGDIAWRYNASSGVVWEDVREDGSSDCATCGPSNVSVQFV